MWNSPSSPIPKNIGLANTQKRQTLEYFAQYSEYNMKWGQFVIDKGTQQMN